MAGAAIATGAAAGLVPLLVSGAFGVGPREIVPVAGILIGGAMAATSLTGRRLLDGVRAELPVIEARLALGAGAREALAPVVRTAVATGLIPVIDQTRTVGLVTLPGTFVGLVLGGASAAEAARVQLTVLLSLLGVELVAALAVAALLTRAIVRPGRARGGAGGAGLTRSATLRRARLPRGRRVRPRRLRSAMTRRILAALRPRGASGDAVARLGHRGPDRRLADLPSPDDDPSRGVVRVHVEHARDLGDLLDDAALAVRAAHPLDHVGPLVRHRRTD